MTCICLFVGRRARSSHSAVVILRESGRGALAPLHNRSSYSAKAEYPVRRGLSIPSLASRSTGSPAFAGDDDWSVTHSFCDRHCERSEAIHSFFVLRHGLLRCARNDGMTHLRVLAARCTRGLLKNLRPENRGRGECRAPDAPAASCALLVVSMHTSIHSEPSEVTRHSRTQWFTAYTVLSPVIGFLATVACERFCKLDAGVEASGPHVFAVRCKQRPSSVPPRPSHPAPRS
jgi:hypothetical protein